MSERWKMNRIGFVNFWLYDEEDFEFEDGKLLLRGQNGSGKSITTQSFIPFVLDGDRTPSRLDPFGSSDRRMEYYFLGEEGKEESTGYLFLEFWKEDSGEYRTIGIGQKAKRGKPMDFWGFVILDGRRVGYDLWLYKEVGSNKIPRDKREMKAELGEDNFFTDSPSEYKKHVNQYIFGFRKEEQYEQFIKLLVKVRAPKLSKEFKPTKVYDILNDSLQTLTDEELRPMVDAMEKMDEIQDSLEMLNRAFDDVKIIRNEYTRYNQYMLAKKAQGYLGKKQEVEKEQAILADQEQRQSEALEEQNRAVQDTERLTAEKKLKETERNALLDPELEDADRKLEKLKAEHQEAVDGEQRWEKKIEDGRERIREEEQNMDDWYKIMLYRLIEVAKRSASKYTRSKVRKALPKDFAYVIEELITEKSGMTDKESYYNSIISTIIQIGRAEEFIVALCELIQRLVVDHLHIVGDIYDRGPGPHLIMDKLMEYHSVDIQWGNHDILWMGAAAGQKCCIANVIRICARYGNLDILEDGYGINLLPLATFAWKQYAKDPCECFLLKGQDNCKPQEMELNMKMHKAISVIQFK